MGSDVYIVGGRVPALRQREPDGEPERRRGAEETTTCAGDDQCSVVPTLPSFVSAVIDSPSTRAAASISEPSASNLSAPAGNRWPLLPGPYPLLLSAASAVDHPTSGLRPADGPSMRACKTCAKPTERLTLGPGLLATIRRAGQEMQAPKPALDRKDPAATPSSPVSCSLRAESAKATASLSNSWTPEARRL
jgi:hypothetical protein